MPERKTSVRKNTVAIQGADSWVIVKPLTYGEVYRTGVTRTHLKTHILEWNWVDEAGKPLPPPTDPTVWDRLTLQEVNYLLELLGGGERRKAMGESFYSHLFTGAGSPPPGWSVLQLCIHVYRCLPTQLLEQDAITIMDHIEMLNQEQRVKEFETTPTHSG